MTEQEKQALIERLIRFRAGIMAARDAGIQIEGEE